jgi:hypothetical protein
MLGNATPVGHVPGCEVERQLRAQIMQFATGVAAPALNHSIRLLDLGLDSLSFVAFLVRVQDAFALSTAQVRSVLMHDCTYGDLLALCRQVCFE